MISLKTRKRPVIVFAALVGAAFACFFISCSGDSEETIRKKLDVICKDDLTAITDSITAKDLLEKPYYKLTFYKQYKEGKYSRKAIAEFYFLKNVAVKVVRKYRYHASIQMWDRYSNEYVFLHDTSSTASDK
jgi:hypothetical protein